MKEDDRDQFSSVTKVKKIELCNLLSLSEQTIANYHKAGLAGVTGKGKSARYNISECIKWVIEYEVQKALKLKVNQKQPEAIDALELRLKTAKVQKAEYEAALLTGSMVTVDDADNEQQRYAEAVRVKLQGIPSAWSPELLGLRDMPEAVTLLEDLVRALMHDIVSEATRNEDDDTPEIGDDVVTPDAH